MPVRQGPVRGQCGPDAGHSAIVISASAIPAPGTWPSRRSRRRDRVIPSAARHHITRDHISLHCSLFLPGNLAPVRELTMSRACVDSDSSRHSSCWLLSRPAPKQRVRATPMHQARVTGLGPRDIIAADLGWSRSSISTTIITIMVVGITTDSAAISGKGNFPEPGVNGFNARLGPHRPLRRSTTPRSPGDTRRVRQERTNESPILG
jgi:hypothetical protein